MKQTKPQRGGIYRNSSEVPRKIPKLTMISLVPTHKCFVGGGLVPTQGGDRTDLADDRKLPNALIRFR